MKNKQKNKNLVLNFLKPISSTNVFKISSKRHNSAVTYSLNFYKPISKFDIIEHGE